MKDRMSRKREGTDTQDQPRRKKTIEERYEELDQFMTDLIETFEKNWNTYKEVQVALGRDYAVKEEEFKKHLETANRIREEQKVHKEKLLQVEAFEASLTFEIENMSPPPSS